MRTIRNNDTMGSMLAVHATQDLEFLVKESEIVTGKPGRKFVIGGADHLAYLVQWLSIGYQVQPLGIDDKPLSTQILVGVEFDAHRLGQALQAGQLFTPSVSH